MNITILNTSILLHILGIVMWLGSLMICSRIMALLVKNGADQSNVWQKKLLFGWLIPGLAITLLTGLYQASATGFAYYFKQGWFHAKLTLVVILIAASILFVKQIISANYSFKSLMIVHGVSALCLLLIIAFTIFGIN